MKKEPEIKCKAQIGNPELPCSEWKEDRIFFVLSAIEQKEAALLLFVPGEKRPFYRLLLEEKYRFGDVFSVCILISGIEAVEYQYTADQMPYPDLLAKKRGTDCRRYLLEKKEKAYQAVRSRRILPVSESIFYKLHVRGFSMERTAKKKGTYQALAEHIPYICSLGVTSVLLMPVYTFFQSEKEKQEISGQMPRHELTAGSPYAPPGEYAGLSERKNYWGYSDGFYFMPNAKYSAGNDPEGELRELVDQLHAHDLECILEFYFPESMSGRFVSDVLRSWLLRFSVDGFRLVGEGGWIREVLADPLLKDCKLLYQNFDASVAAGYKDAGKAVRSGRLCLRYHPEFKNLMRRFLKGDEELFLAPRDMLLAHTEAFTGINYFADNDGFTMYDMTAYSEKHNEENGENNRDGAAYNFSWNCGTEGETRKRTINRLRIQQLKNAFAILMTAQAVPLIYAGDEHCNSQTGNNNAWCQDNPTGWVNLRKNRMSEELLDFVRNMTAFRKRHQILHRSGSLFEPDKNRYGYPPVSTHGKEAWHMDPNERRPFFALLYCGMYAGSPEMLFIIYNMHWKEQEFALPPVKDGYWEKEMDTALLRSFTKERVDPDKKSVTASPRSVMIFSSVKFRQQGRK